MDFLEKIVAHKKGEITERKDLIPVRQLEKSIYFNGPGISLVEYIQRKDKHGVIAEFKRASPSAGEISAYADSADVCRGYMQSGASALAVFTDKKFFNGRNEDLTIAREWNYCPILRKDIIVDEYQIIESKSIGADVIFLLLSVLSREKVKKFIELAHNLDMEVMCEIHDPSEWYDEAEDCDLIGVNSRDYRQMKVVDGHHQAVKEILSIDKMMIAKNGIQDAQTGFELMEMGYDGILVGHAFMSKSDPVLACRQFIDQLEKLKENKKLLSRI